MNKMAPEKIVVQTFYDQVGWQEDSASRVFMDAHLFDDLRAVTEPYRARANERVRELLDAGGKFLLDVASGPVQFESYQRFSDPYGKRVCVDLSIRALTGARSRIGDRGWFVQADITALPFRDDVFDGIVSMHTIYHVPADEQQIAIRELYRTLKPGRRAVVVYNWPRNPLKRLIAFPFELVDGVKGMILKIPGARYFISRIKRRFSRGRSEQIEFEENHRASLSLYFHAHPLRWFRRQSDSLFQLDLLC